MAKFQCQISKTYIEVADEWDIKSFRKHPDYTEVDVNDKPLPPHQELINFWNANQSKTQKTTKAVNVNKE